jgi:hypothetical protein
MPDLAGSVQSARVDSTRALFLLQCGTAAIVAAFGFNGFDTVRPASAFSHPVLFKLP